MGCPYWFSTPKLRKHPGRRAQGMLEPERMERGSLTSQPGVWPDVTHTWTVGNCSDPHRSQPAKTSSMEVSGDFRPLLAKELLAVGDGYGRGSQSSSKGGHCQVNRLIFMSSTDWTQWVIKKKAGKIRKKAWSWKVIYWASEIWGG